MGAKTKLQLETELKEAQATIAKLKRDLKEAWASGEEKKLTDKNPAKTSQREEDFLKLLEILPVGVSILDDKRKVVFQNSALSQILDINAEGIRTGAYKNRKYLTSDGTAMPPDGFASVQAQSSGHAVYNVETGVIKENGETIWTSVSAVPADFPDWKMVIVTSDITKRKQSEIALQESEEKYSALFAKSAIPAALTKLPEVVFMDINEAFQSVYGYSRAEVIGKTSLEIGMTIPVEHSQTSSELEKKNFLRDNEKHLFTKSGEARIGTINISKVKISGQDFVITTIHDITERKQLESHIQKSERAYRELVQNANSAIIRWKRNGEISFFNEFAQSFFGYQKDEVLGRSIGILVPDIDSIGGDLSSLVQNVVENPDQFVNVVNENICKDGRRVWMAWTNKPIYDEDGQVNEILAVGVDITERKQVEDALWKSEQRFRTAIKPSFMVLAQTDLNARYTWLHNPHPDFDSDSVVGKTDIELADNDGTQMLYQSKLRVIATGQGIQTEISFPVSDGLRVYDVIIDPLYDVDGKLLGVTTSSYDITEHKRAEEKIRESEEFLRLANEATDLGVWKNDLVTGRVEFDERARIHYGFDTLQTTIPELMKHIHPDDVARLGSEIAAVTGPTGNGKFTTEYRVIHPDGSVHWLAIGVRVIFEGEGEGRQSVMGYGTSLDITERKRSERALIQSQESFAKAFSSNPTALAITRNADGKFININDTYSSIMGYDPLEVIGHTALELSIYVDPKEREGLLQVLAEKGKVLNYELTVRCKDQEIREILVSMEPINYNNEDCILSAFVDITELKQAQQALLSSQKLLQSIIDNTPALVYSLDIEGRFLLINRPLEKLFGHTNAEMIGYRREDFVPLELARQHRANDLEIFQSGEGKTFEEENMEPDGRRVYLTTKFPLRDAEGNIYAVCGISTDMTERKLIEEELIRSNAELEQFAYIASHDLQEPLRAVAGMVQLLQRRYLGKLDERADEYIRHAVDASARMQALIQALLSYSRAQRNNQPIEQVDAGTCLQTALKNLDTSIRESHAVITTDALPHVYANAAQLTQLLQNLIGNGIKFRGDEEPQIHISVTKLKDAWQFSIRDNGIGIEPQYFERIFLIFQRLHTQREYAGTGIGLALCKKIIDRHGGRIWVESEPQRGSTFHFTIPFRSKS